MSLNEDKLKDILDQVIRFASSQDQVLALGLCGSWARGTAGPESDIDLSIIVKDKDHFKSTRWMEDVDFEEIGEALNSYEDRTYGRVWSRHVLLLSGIKIEFSFADPSWADPEVPDRGTLRVIQDGYRILYDPKSILNRLLAKVNSLG